MGSPAEEISQAAGSKDTALAVCQPEQHNCPRCLQDVDMSECAERRGSTKANQKAVIWCQECVNADKRIQRLQKPNGGNHDFSGLKNLNDAEKTNMMKEAHALCGARLAMLCATTMQAAQERINKLSFQCQESFMDEEQVRITFKDRPIKMKSILDTPDEFCIVNRSREKQYPIEEYTRCKYDEDRFTSKRSRDAEFEETIKPKAKAKAPKRAKAIENGQVEPTDGQDAEPGRTSKHIVSQWVPFGYK